MDCAGLSLSVWYAFHLIHRFYLFGYQGIQFQDAKLERRYLLHVAQHGLRMDSTILCMATVIGVASSASARFSDCDELAERPCPVGFWVLPAACAGLCAGASIMLIAAMRWRALHQKLVERYQSVITSFFLVFCILCVSSLPEIQILLTRVYCMLESRLVDRVH